MRRLFIVCSLLRVCTESVVLQRRAFVQAAVVSVTTAAGVVDAVPPFLADAPELRGRAPNQPPSGPLAGTPLGFKVGGGPRPESEVRKIDEARYAAVRGPERVPSFLDGVPRETAEKR